MALNRLRYAVPVLRSLTSCHRLGMLGSKQWFGSASPAVQREDVLKYLPALMPRPALTDREVVIG